MGYSSGVPSDNLIQRCKDTADERGSMLEDNRDDDDQDRYDSLGEQVDEISEELIDRGVKDW